MFRGWVNLFKKKTDIDQTKKHKVDTYTRDNLDTIFAEHFTQNGGFFNYVSDSQESIEVLKTILNTLQPERVFCFEKQLQSQLNVLQQPYQNSLDKNCDMALIDCECLVALDGSIMVSSDNIKSYKLQALPKNIVIFGQTNQLVSNKSRGLEYIRRAKKECLPSNITSLNAKKSQDFLKQDYIKELYLLLIESIA